MILEKFMATNAGDFRQRYEGTYGWYIAKDKRVLVSILAVGEGVLQFIDRNSIKYTLNRDSTEDIGFSFLAPKMQWHNTKDFGPVLVQRIPQKQYRRGICSNNTRITNKDGVNLGVNFHTLAAVFENISPVSEASKKLSFALSPQFMVDTDKGVLKCYASRIGQVTKSKDLFVTELSIKHLSQEVGDSFRRANLEVVLK